jgi:hypothetical protein
MKTEETEKENFVGGGKGSGKDSSHSQGPTSELHETA